MIGIAYVAPNCPASAGKADLDSVVIVEDAAHQYAHHEPMILHIQVMRGDDHAAPRRNCNPLCFLPGISLSKVVLAYRSSKIVPPGFKRVKV